MLSIQEAASQILSGNPKNLYFFTGPEYGIKRQYLSLLESKYGSCDHFDSFLQIVDSLSGKSLLKRVPKVYVARYDKEFISKLNNEMKTKVLGLKFPGTVVGIFESDKDEAKLDKYFPDNTVRLNYLTRENTIKHLAKDFPTLSEIHLNHVAEIGSDLFQCQTMCRCLTLLDPKKLHNLSKKEFDDLFGYQHSYQVERFKLAIAARNMQVALEELDKYDGEYSLLYYDILSTYIEIAKLFEKKYSDSVFKKYMKVWNPQTLKYMYDLAYGQLQSLRSNSLYNQYNSIVYTICNLR